MEEGPDKHIKPKHLQGWFTIGELARLFETEDRQVRQWLARRDVPRGLQRAEEVMGGRIMVHGNAFLHYMVDHHLLPKPIMDKLSNLGKIKTSYEEARARKMRVQADLLEGKYVDRDLVKKRDIEKIVFFKKGLMGLLQRIPPQCDGMEARQIFRIMHKEFHELLKEFAEGDRVVPEDLAEHTQMKRRGAK